MNVTTKITLLERLGAYLNGQGTEEEREHLRLAKQKAFHQNGWFIPEFVDLSIQQIADNFLQRPLLEAWVAQYPGFGEPASPKNVGIVAAGNIPLVGFHDWLTGFLSGHRIKLKLSSKDDVLLPHLIGKIAEWSPEAGEITEIREVLKDCDAYIATGSNNSARYFEYYFSKYPHIIRRNRTSVAVLTGSETTADLEALASDALLYFGLGCRNVTKVYVPEGYDFEALMTAFRQFDWLMDNHKYKNNYDYNLALLMLNSAKFQTNDNLLLHENESVFSPLSVLHYGVYRNRAELEGELAGNPDLQCIVAADRIPFGQAQAPRLSDYADGVDTPAFYAAL